jgi:predicted anti-sigma-YlaC factor YlaD
VIGIPARCERSREWVSLRLDGQLSTFEAALLDRHLRRCDDCRAFAAGAGAQTRLLRAAPLELPSRSFAPVLQASRSSRRRGIVGVVGAAAAVAAAAAALVAGTGGLNHGTADASSADASNRPQFKVVPAKASPSVALEVPRLKVEPASAADGPVHGIFAQPA